MLYFVCNNCLEKFKASINMRSIKYTDGERSFPITSDDELCYQCIEIAKQAAHKAEEEALKKRKK